MDIRLKIAIAIKLNKDSNAMPGHEALMRI